MKRAIAILLVFVLALGLGACAAKGSNTVEELGAKTTGWLIFVAIVGLVVQLGFAAVFSGIAEEKGYSPATYFWVCFLFGVAGYCVVAALPDQVLRFNTRGKRSDVAPTLERENSSPRIQAKNGWTCSCGRKNADYVSTCICGINKHECQ